MSDFPVPVLEPSPRSETALSEREQRVVDFLRRWSISCEAFGEAFDELATEDVIWDARPIPVIKGRRAAKALLKKSAAQGIDRVEIDILRVGSCDDAVFVERVDRILRRDGSLIAASDVAAVMTFSGDRLVHWREYYDFYDLLVKGLWSTGGYMVGRLGRAARSVVAGKQATPQP